MKIKEIIEHLESQGDWVNWECTRDHILFGQDSKEIDYVMICWVATTKVIKKAIEKKCHFIITHENPFYMTSTALPSLLIEAQKEKEVLLKENDITLYRCHDLWDLYPKYGVRDKWAEILHINFQESLQNKYLRISEKFHMSVSELAMHIIKCIEPYNEYGVEIIGDKKQIVHCLGIGTGACTNVLDMYNLGADVCLVSDDGINNWVYTQWAMDHHIPLIVVNHLTSEAPGIEAMSSYLSKVFPNIKFEYVSNDYGIHHIEKTLR